MTTTQFQTTAAVSLWANIVGKQIEADLNRVYGRGLLMLGPSLRNDIIHGHILRALLQMDRLSRGDAIESGELDARVQAVASYLNPRINPEY